MMTVLQFRFREQVILEFLRHLEDEICFEVLSKCLEHAQSLSQFRSTKFYDDVAVFKVEYFHITPLCVAFERPHDVPIVTNQLEDVLREETVTPDGADDSVEVALVLYLHAVELGGVHDTGSCADNFRFVFENSDEFTPRRHL